MSQEWSDSELLTEPQVFVIGRAEGIPYSWDISAVLGEGESASDPDVTPWLMQNGRSRVAVEDATSDVVVIGEDIIVATFDGTKFRDGQLYRIVVTFNCNPGKRISVATMLRCVA